MKTVVIAGGTGTIGTRLVAMLENSGYRPLVLTRNAKKAAQSERLIHWDLDKGIVGNGFEQANHIINLSGEGIADGRWSISKKQAILNSRIDSTQLLVDELTRRSMKIKSFISASAIGYYGDGGQKVLTEDSGVMTKEFLSDVCVAWEHAATGAKSKCQHLCIVRIGTVLTSEGGALQKMDQTIPLGIASYLGSGKQQMSWIHIDDLCDLFIHCLDNKLSGIFNAVAPEVLSNKDFTNELRKSINKKALLIPAPAFAIKMALGEMARVVLNSSNVSSEKIRSTGFQFRYPVLRNALKEIYQD